MLNKAWKPTNETWSKKYSTCFFHPRPPFDVKYDIETTTEIQVDVLSSDTAELVYFGASNLPPLGTNFRLSFGAVVEEGNWFQIEAE